MADLPLWYENVIGHMIVCEDCKKDAILNWGPNRPGVGIDEVVHPRDFRALGRTPWAGNPEGDRYMQCDGCNGQWGPDA